MAGKPKVSIIILNWNGKKWLQKCLSSFKKVSYSPFEIIIVNNGSTDDSAIFLKENYPKVRVIELKRNVGFAKANNIGVKQARGKYVLILNNDTTVSSNFLQSLVNKMEKDSSIGAIQPQMRSMINKKVLDSAGSYLTSTGFLYYLEYMKPYKSSKYKNPLPVYSIKGACFMMRRNEYIKLGGFDEDFFCYVEETDLCHRIWLSGKSVLYDPDSYMYHYGGGDMQVMTKNEITIYRSFRNRVLSYLKNLNTIELIKILPVHILICEMYIMASFLRGRFKQSIAAQIGIIACIGMFSKTMKKRRYIQKKIRRVKDAELMFKIKHNPRLSYYFYLFYGLEKYNY